MKLRLPAAQSEFAKKKFHSPLASAAPSSAAPFRVDGHWPLYAVYEPRSRYPSALPPETTAYRLGEKT
jgi:hypothetical protein